MTAAHRHTDICTGHSPCFPPRPNAQASPNVFINNLGSHRLTDAWQSHCLVGSTKIQLLSGKSATIESLVGSFEGEFVYSCTEEGKIVPGKIVDAFVSTYADTLIKIQLDNAKSIVCSTDHLIMLRDGSYIEAQFVKAGDSLMPLYKRLTKKGYEEVWDNNTEGWQTTHKMAALSNTRQHLKAQSAVGKRGNKFLVVHHKNFLKRDNRPTNLRWMGFIDHYKWHSTHGHSTWINATPKQREARRAKMSAASKISTRRNVENGTHNFVANHPMLKAKNRKKIVQSNQHRLDIGTHHFISDNPMKHGRSKAKSIATHKENWKLKPDRVKQKIRDKIAIASQEMVLNGTHHLVTNNPMKDPARKIAMCRAKIVRIYKAIRQEGLVFNKKSYNDFYFKSAPGWEKAKTYFKSPRDLAEYAKYNHGVLKVTRIKLDEKIPLYDLSIYNAQHTHNFALTCGVFVHNCCGTCHGSTACQGSPNVFVNNLNKCRIGDAVCCGSTMATGSPNVFVNGM
jgi:hypothetical protein